MSVIFDNLTAILVTAVLAGALLVVQMRRQESAIGATVRNRVEFQAGEFVSVVQRDAENIRTRQQTEAAFGEYRFRLRRATGADGESYTSQASFPTLAEPELGDASPVAIVTYTMTPTGGSVRVGRSTRPTYSVARRAYTRAGGLVETGGAVGVVDFDVFLVAPDGRETTSAPDRTDVSETPAQVRIAVMTAAAAALRRSGDQAATTAQNATRRTTTARVISAAATGGLPPVEPGAAGIPPLPGDPPTLPPPSTSPSPPATSPGPSTPVPTPVPPHDDDD